MAWESSEDLQPRINSAEYPKYFPKLSPQSLWKTFPIVESHPNEKWSPSWIQRVMPETWGIFSLAGKRADIFEKEWHD